VFVATVLVGIDQLTKWLIVNNIQFGTSVPGIRFGDLKFVDITHIHNTGAAFGIFKDRQFLLIAVTSIFLFGAIIVLFSGRIKMKMMFAAITLIIAGAVGNLIDRATQGYVVDFIELKFINFAIFNFADMCVVIGTFILFLSVVREEIRDYRAKRACEVEDDDGEPNELLTVEETKADE